MGFSSYSTDNRTLNASVKGYATKRASEIFVQQKLRDVHKDMNPKNVALRECCDSEAHPKTVPVQLYLDVTGSMGMIPHELIKVGLPTLISNCIQRGVEDIALMFGAIGDHECDQHPLQIAQFESGDEELDMWLERVYLEGGGGGNAGESYLLAWYFSAHHTRTDSFDVRHKKGFVFTVGDEPTLHSLPMSAIKGIMGKTACGESTYTSASLLAEAQVKNHVYHIHITHGGRKPDEQLKQLLGQNFIEITDHTKLAETISNIIINNTEHTSIETKEDDPITGSIEEQEKLSEGRIIL